MNIEKHMELEEKIADVLCTKNFSDMAKSHIKRSLRLMSVIPSLEMEQHIFEVIEGLKRTNIFQIGTRLKLAESKEFKGHIHSDIGGCVSLSREKVAVIKDQWYLFSMVHELSHVAQPQDAYRLPQLYDFSSVFQLAMLEGEACYFEGLFAQKYTPHLTSRKRGYLSVSYQPSFYDICLELYQDMRNLFGVSLLQKWKYISKDYDIMPELELYMKEHYQSSFSEIYQLWIMLLYQSYLKNEMKMDFISKQMVQHNMNQRYIYDAMKQFEYQKTIMENSEQEIHMKEKASWYQQFQMPSLFTNIPSENLQFIKNQMIMNLERRYDNNISIQGKTNYM